MITISHTFQYRIVLNIFKISGHLSKKSDTDLWSGGNKNTAEGCADIDSVDNVDNVAILALPKDLY